MITVFILLVAIGVLGWGFYRARPFGQRGILAWLQSVVLMAPWLTFFGLFAAGIYLNLAGVLLLLVLSIGGYIGIGNRLRTLSADPTLQKSSLPTPPSEAAGDRPSSPHTDSSTHSSENSGQPTGRDTSQLAATPPPEVARIPAEDLQSIQSIFGIDTFFAVESIPYQEGAIFKGNLRAEAGVAHAKLAAGLKQKVGDRYRLFLVSGPENKPTVVVLPSSNDPAQTTTAQWALAGVLAIATLATCAETSGLLLGFDLTSNVSRFQETLPIALGIVAVLVVHEVGHWLSANQHQVRLSPPFFLPNWQIGAFGALTRFESLLPNRSALFDIAFAGPAAGGLVSLGLLLAGLLLSHPGSLFQIPADFFQGSILVGTLARVVLGDAVQQALVDVHPLTVIGWLGLVITALNLMPAGQLDGGRIVQAIYGRTTAGRTTIGTILILGIISFVNPLALYWTLVLLFLQRGLERPTLNDLTDPDDARAALGLLALFLMAATLLPLTPGLAGRLGIGG